MAEQTTVLELIVALLGIAGIGFSSLAVIDDVWDLRIVRREGMAGGPRWISARGYLGLNTALLCAWLGYTVVAMIAAYLPPSTQPGIAGWTWGDITSVSRLEFGGAMLVGQILQRVTRSILRRLPRSAWEQFFGEATMWRSRYLTSQADIHEARAQIRRLEAEAATHRADKHDALNRETRVSLRLQHLQRWLKQQGIVPPEPGEHTDITGLETLP